MYKKLKRFLGFPYDKKYESGYNKDIMMTMHKPLLLIVIATLLFVTWLVGICIFLPETIAPPEYISGLLLIHLVFMTFTIIVLLLVVGLRRKLFEAPNLYILLCNIYAIGVCLWASLLSAYANYSAAVYTAFVFVTLCVAMVSLFKPYMAIIVFAGNYILYYFLIHYFSETFTEDTVARLYNAALAALLGIVIAIAFYRFRTRTYYGRQIITQQMEEIHAINAQLQQLIYIDNLTGIYNRRFYEEVLPETLHEMQQTNGYACMMFDIDYFKLYNDKYGHPMGDHCLRMVSETMQAIFTAKDAYLVRYGGEEFLALAPIDGKENALELAKEVCHAIEEKNMSHVGSPLGHVTLSGGLTYHTQGEEVLLETLAKEADEALYDAKQKGRNQVAPHWE